MTKVIARKGTGRGFGIGVCVLAFLGVCWAQPPSSTGSAEKLYLQLRSVGLDQTRVYHVRNLSIDRSAIHISLDSGTIAFTQNLAGQVTGAFFAGDGEVLLSPPTRVERASMALFTGAAILEEQFVSAYFRFNDDSFAEMRPSLQPSDQAQEFVSEWDGTAKRLAAVDALRLLLTYSHLLATDPPQQDSSPSANDRMFHARLQGIKLGTFDLYYDSQAAEQVWAGQIKSVEGNTYLDVWTSFSPRSAAGGREAAVNSVTGEESASRDVDISRYTIKAEVHPPTDLNVDATLDMEVHQGGARALLFELSRFLQVKQVDDGGHPVEFIHNPSIEGTRLERRGNDLVAVVFPQPLQAGQKLKLHFVYGGAVLSEAGEGLLYVGARGTWYPNRGLAMSNFDLEFRYPPGWTLVATGKQLSTSEPAVPPPASTAPQAEQMSHWISERPIPLAGFNLGKYTRADARAGHVGVETYATAGVEHGFPQPPAQQVVSDYPGPPHAPKQIFEITPPAPSPARNAQAVADTSARAIDFYAQHFGPYPYSGLELTQMPGPLSQGWPGLIFLSSFSFLTEKEKSDLHLSQVDTALSECVVAHETAHQWWGDLIMWAGYRDQWLVEGLANYSALMLLESKDPARFRQVMAKYRDDLIEKNKQDEYLMDAGPVTLGSRLSSSHFPGGYEAISYGRGTWLFHMLRTMMRDAEPKSPQPTEEPFMRALRKLREQYAGKAVTSQQVIQVFAQELPRSLWYEGRQSLDWFYEGWVNGTALPRFELNGLKYIDRGKETIVTGTIEQKSAPDDLVTSVPIYASEHGRVVLLGRTFADGSQSTFRFIAPAGTRKVVLDPYQTLLARQR